MNKARSHIHLLSHRGALLFEATLKRHWGEQYVARSGQRFSYLPEPECFISDLATIERMIAATAPRDDRAIDAAIAARTKARQDRDFARADAIRDDLARQGVVLEDGADGTAWRIERDPSAADEKMGN